MSPREFSHTNAQLKCFSLKAEVGSGAQPMIERRMEARVRLSLPVTVSGIDVEGERFVTRVLATSLSRSGALLTGFGVGLRSGDMLAVEYEGHRADFRVVWVLDLGRHRGAEVAVHKPSQQPCPWEDVLSDEVALASAADGNSNQP
jgi:hypothetical protein